MHILFWYSLVIKLNDKNQNDNIQRRKLRRKLRRFVNLKQYLKFIFAENIFVVDA